MKISPDGNIDENGKIYPKWQGVMAMLGVAVGVIFMLVGFVTAPKGGIYFIIGLYLVIFMYIGTIQHFSSYEFCKDGIWIKKPFVPEKLVYWESYQQVCICYLKYSVGKCVVLAFVKKGMKPIVNEVKEAKTSFYIDNMILMDYSKDLYEKVKMYCPLEIKNLTKLDIE